LRNVMRQARPHDAGDASHGLQSYTVLETSSRNTYGVSRYSPQTFPDMPGQQGSAGREACSWPGAGRSGSRRSAPAPPQASRRSLDSRTGVG
jgi:hypothetical protein